MPRQFDRLDYTLMLCCVLSKHSTEPGIAGFDLPINARLAFGDLCGLMLLVNFELIAYTSIPYMITRNGCGKNFRAVEQKSCPNSKSCEVRYFFLVALPHKEICTVHEMLKPRKLSQ